jgi:hypothetical protein
MFNSYPYFLISLTLGVNDIILQNYDYATLIYKVTSGITFLKLLRLLKVLDQLCQGFV